VLSSDPGAPPVDAMDLFSRAGRTTAQLGDGRDFAHLGGHVLLDPVSGGLLLNVLPPWVHICATSSHALAAAVEITDHDRSGSLCERDRLFQTEMFRRHFPSGTPTVAVSYSPTTRSRMPSPRRSAAARPIGVRPRVSETTRGNLNVPSPFENKSRCRSYRRWQQRNRRCRHAYDAWRSSGSDLLDSLRPTLRCNSGKGSTQSNFVNRTCIGTVPSIVSQ
jgi:hypothetical protein